MTNRHESIRPVRFADSAKRAAGFTLIELMLYVSLVSILLVGVTSFFTVVKEINIKNRSISAVEEQGAFVSDRINAYLRAAGGVCAPSGAGSTGGTLDLDSNCLSHTASEVEVALDGSGRVTVSIGGGTALRLTDDRVYVSSLSFSNTADTGAPANIQYSITMQARSYGTTSEYYYQKTFVGGGTIRQ